MVTRSFHQLDKCKSSNLPHQLRIILTKNKKTKTKPCCLCGSFLKKWCYFLEDPCSKSAAAFPSFQVLCLSTLKHNVNLYKVNESSACMRFHAYDCYPICNIFFFLLQTFCFFPQRTQFCSALCCNKVLQNRTKNKLFSFPPQLCVRTLSSVKSNSVSWVTINRMRQHLGLILVILIKNR